MISVHFQGKPLNITIIQAYAPTSNAEEDEVERFYATGPFRINTPKRFPFHYRGLECKSRKSRNTLEPLTHLEPDILECEVKGALESITTNKASGGDGIPVELFQILEDDAVKVLHSICQHIWKTQQWPQDWKGQFSFQSQRRQCKRMLKLPHNCTHLTC